jgi:hypothetical protein
MAVWKNSPAILAGIEYAPFLHGYGSAAEPTQDGSAIFSTEQI